MNAQKHFEEKLMQRVAKHAAFIRTHGRYPLGLDALWPTVATFAGYGAIELIFWFSGWYNRGHLFLLEFNVLVFFGIAFLNIRALFFGHIQTRTPEAEAVQTLQVALAAAGYSLAWTPGHDAALLFVTAGGGSLAKRHAVLFVPMDGRIWYNVHDPRGANFFVTDRKPLRNLIRQIESAFAH